MSNNDWNDLERLWQSLPAKAAPAVEELRRYHRWRWASYALIAGDVVMTIVGFGAGVWLLTRPNTFALLMGIATLVFVTLAAALAWWARAVVHVPLGDSVANTVALAIWRARIGVRLALAVQWAVVMGAMFTALLAFGRTYGQSFDIGTGHTAFMAIAIAQLWLAVCLAGAIIYHRKRAADLARLEALRASLNE
jgi:hypothetical protein